MNRDAEKTDLLDVFEFIKKLLEKLVETVPGPHSRQFRRVWKDEIKPKLEDVEKKVKDLSDDAAEWKTLQEVGWTGEQARLKSDVMATVAGQGLLGKVLKLVNSALGSLKVVFIALDPVKEFKDFLEIFLPSGPEPVEYIQTLFGRGPIPG
jgi:hypothetical protein